MAISNLYRRHPHLLGGWCDTLFRPSRRSKDSAELTVAKDRNGSRHIGRVRISLRSPLRFQSPGICGGTELLDEGTKPRMGQAAVGTRVPDKHHVE
jgi:hypothetical protein